MSTAKSVAQIIPGVMSMGLLAEAVKAVPTEKEMKKGKFDSKKQLKMATKMLVGIPLIGVVSQQVNTLP